MKDHDGGSPFLPLRLPVQPACRTKKADGKSARRTKRPGQKTPPTEEGKKQGIGILWRVLREVGQHRRSHLSPQITYVHADAAEWLTGVAENSIHAIVTDPPYGLIEYNETNHSKMRNGRGGVWRIPPSFDGASRKPVPRFTVLTNDDKSALMRFFEDMAREFARVLVPGGHIFIASNPLLSSQTFVAFQRAGLEKRGEVIRLVQTLRGGDRPKNAHEEFRDVSMMPRSCWEPWGLFRKPMEGTAAANLRKWGTGGLRRISGDEPFKDVIECPPARGKEKEIAPHPSLKPQCFLRQIVRAALPMGVGTIYDPFAGSGSTLAAAKAVGYTAIGTERDVSYFEMGCAVITELAALEV
jgi:site-specific DNA-methyltransferase (adenine-specific)